MELAIVKKVTHHTELYNTTQKCRLMGKEVREILRFCVASPRMFPLSVWRVSHTSLPKNTYNLVQCIPLIVSAVGPPKN